MTFCRLLQAPHEAMTEKGREKTSAAEKPLQESAAFKARGMTVDYGPISLRTNPTSGVIATLAAAGF